MKNTYTVCVCQKLLKTGIMFTIEVMNSEDACQMKCFTCPASVQRMKGSKGSVMIEAYKLLQNLVITTGTPFAVIFNHDISTAIEKANLYDLKEMKTLALHVSLPVDTVIMKSVLQTLHCRFPKTSFQLTTLDKRNEVTEEIVANLTEIAHTFFSSELPYLKFGFNNNAVAYDVYRQELVNMPNTDRNLYNTVFKRLNLPYAIPHKRYANDEKVDVEIYDSILQIKNGGQYFQITRRNISECIDPSISKRERFYKKAQIEITNSEEFTREELGLTLTPIGIRVKHQSYDVDNPFLWFSYEELFTCIKANKNIDDFCRSIRDITQQTFALAEFDLVENSLLETVSEQIITELAAKRKEHYSKGG